MGLILQTTGGGGGGGGGGSNSTGYVGGGTQYMITNTLEIFASAAIQTLLKLNLIRSERIGDLDAMEIQCSPKEVKLCFTRKRGWCASYCWLAESAVWPWFCSNHFLRSVNWCELGWNPSFTPLHKNISREVASFTEMPVKAICFGCIFAEENGPQKQWVTHFVNIDFRNSPTEMQKSLKSDQDGNSFNQGCHRHVWLLTSPSEHWIFFLLLCEWMSWFEFLTIYKHMHSGIVKCISYCVMGCAGVTAVESITILHQCAKWSVWQALCQLNGRYMLLVCSYICEMPSVLTCAFIVGLRLILRFTLCISKCFCFQSLKPWVYLLRIPGAYQTLAQPR